MIELGGVTGNSSKPLRVGDLTVSSNDSLVENGKTHS